MQNLFPVYYKCFFLRCSTNYQSDKILDMIHLLLAFNCHFVTKNKIPNILPCKFACLLLSFIQIFSFKIKGDWYSLEMATTIEPKALIIFLCFPLDRLQGLLRRQREDRTQPVQCKRWPRKAHCCVRQILRMER